MTRQHATTQQPVVYDASVLLNLLASGQPADLIRVSGTPGYVTPAVVAETLYIRGDDPANPLEPVSLEPLIEAGLLEVCPLETAAEYALYVSYAAQLDDGEAMSLAICRARNYILATDDKKARRVASGLTPGPPQEATQPPIPLLETPQILRRWADHRVDDHTPDAETIRALLRRIERKARYRPPATDDPPYRWWETMRAE